MVEAGNQAHRWLDIVPPPHVGITDETEEAVGLKTEEKNMQNTECPAPAQFAVLLKIEQNTGLDEMRVAMERTGMIVEGRPCFGEDEKLMRRFRSSLPYFATRYPKVIAELYAMNA